MKKLVKRKRNFRVNNPLAFGILCAMLLIFTAGVTYALAAGVISPVVRSYRLAHATPTPTPTIAPATPEPATPTPATDTPAPSLEPGATPTPTPAPEGGVLSGKIIGVDPARGYSSKIKGVSTGIYANRLNYAVATLVKEKLEAQGATVVMGLEDVATDKDSADRVKTMNEGNVALAVRIECNSIGDGATRGAIAWIPAKHAGLEECRKLANAVLDAYIEATNLTIAQFNGASLRQKDDDTFLQGVTAPVCTIVTGYISNDVEDRTLNNETFQNNMADGIVKGIVAYLGA